MNLFKKIITNVNNALENNQWTMNIKKRNHLIDLEIKIKEEELKRLQKKALRSDTLN